MKNSFVIPTVEDSDGKIIKSYDIYSRLLKDRIIMLCGEVNDDIANLIVAQILFLDSENNEEPIELYINSPGGSITAGMAIYDAMRLATAPIHTICIGMAASMGAFLLSQGEQGHRTAALNSEIMIHQPLGGFRGQETDIQIHARRIAKMKMKLVQLMADSTCEKTDPSTMWELCERDNFLEPEEALEIGLIDKII